ncbi:MAG: metallophosphoesterase [SAR324 cluster bacterium]|nr:metallophosphoesterase [SAR324 cluster bacterium]
MQKPITLLHVSDFHFSDDSLRLKDLIRSEGVLSKRITGWLNHHKNPARQMRTELRSRLIDYLSITPWDYLVFAGDLTTLSLEQEFAEARRQMAPLIQKGTVIMLPGNHDRYTKKALNPDLMARTFSDCFPFNTRLSKSAGIRYLELGEQAVLFEIDMVCPRFHTSSRGAIKTDLIASQAFISRNYHDRLKLVVGHYPAFLPEPVKEGVLHKLAGKNRLQQFLVASNIDLYLHGHIHKTWQTTPPNQARPMCLDAGGCCRHANGPWSGLHQITITENRYQLTRIQLPVT